MANDPEEENNDGEGLRSKISGAAQVIIGEIEEIGGILTADPVTRAEGELNVEVGTVRKEVEAELEESEENNDQ
jgi:division protein CdvB (Snf7/Vps24/ESCRT-III family)